MDIFKDLVSWAKANAKDGANVAEFEELVSKAAPPDDSLKAIEYIRAVPSLRSAYDAAMNREFDRAVKKYEEEKLPEKEKELKEAIRRELNPTETPEQKENRELKEKIRKSDEKEALTTKQNALRAKAKDYGVDPEVAADYARYGDDAEDILKRHAEWHKKELDAVKAETARATFGNKTPTGGSSLNSKPQAEFFKLTPKERAEFMAAGGVLTD